LPLKEGKEVVLIIGQVEEVLSMILWKGRGGVSGVGGRRFQEVGCVGKQDQKKKGRSEEETKPRRQKGEKGYVGFITLVNAKKKSAVGPKGVGEGGGCPESLRGPL